MKRVKFLKKIGDSAGIIFNKEERLLGDFDVGDKVVINIRKVK